MKELGRKERVVRFDLTFGIEEEEEEVPSSGRVVRRLESL